MWEFRTQPLVVSPYKPIKRRPIPTSQSGALRPSLCLVQFRVLLHTTSHFLHHFGSVSSATSYTVRIYIPPYTPAVRAAFNLLLLRNSAFLCVAFLEQLLLWSCCCCCQRGIAECCAPLYLCWSYSSFVVFCLCSVCTR